MNPESTIHLCKTPLENDYQNTLTFSSIQEQKSYFNSIIGLSFSDYTYLRKDKSIVVDGLVDDLRQYNYLFYENPTTFKTYYCFINKHEYVSENSTRLYIETDVFQTWQFDIVYRNSFIEREHVNDDTAGLHTVPENVEKGEYIINRVSYDTHLTDLKLVVASSVTPSEGVSLIGANYNGIYSGIRYYTYPASTMTQNLQFLTDNTKQEGVTSLFMAPSFLCTNQGGAITESTEPESYSFSVNRQTTLNGYTPKNKKLLTYPYIYLNVSNGCGGNAIYHEELFTSIQANKLEFTVQGALCPGCSIKTVPLQYKNDISNYDESLNAGKFPQLNWATDMYTNWVTQNGVNVATDIVGETAQIGAGIASRDVGGTLSGTLGIANSIREIQLARKIPPQVKGNINSGDITTSAGENTFHYYSMSIREEYARIIDDYFSMYGYKVNRVKSPNITGRRNWNYVKTINCNFTGDIPQDDMQIIKQIFNDGVTLWHNPSTFLNYSANNDII